MERQQTWSVTLFAALAALAVVATGVPARPAIRFAVQARPAPVTRPAAAPVRQPFPGAAGDARQVVSVQAAQLTSRTARLTLWERAAVGAPWHRIGTGVPVRLGADGVTAHPREGLPATPLGSYTLTHALGRDPQPGVRLDYRRLRPGDGWNTAPGPGYNRLGHTGELWAGRNGWSQAAVLIDYNVDHPRPGAGSGFFLHVADGGPTSGCVGLPRRAMLALLRWLDPAAHPRVVIAVGGG